MLCSAVAAGCGVSEGGVAPRSAARVKPRPTREEISAYYAAHPELFAQRRVYSLDEVVLANARLNMGRA